MKKAVFIMIFVISLFFTIHVNAIVVDGADMSINNDYNTKRKLTYTFGAANYGLYEAYLKFNEVYIGPDDRVYYVDKTDTKEIEGSNFVVHYLDIPYTDKRTYATKTISKDPFDPNDFPKLQKDTHYKITMCVVKSDELYTECSDDFFWLNVTEKVGSSAICSRIKDVGTPAGILRCYAAGCHIDNNGNTRKCAAWPNVTTTKPAVEPAPTTCEEIFGSFYNDLQYGVKAYKIIAPLAVLLFSVMDYLKAIFSKDAEGLKDANKKLIKRGILLVVLFFLPTILDLMIHLLIGTEFGTCLG